MQRVWCLNLDVEREWENPSSYQLTRQARAAVARAIPRIQGELLGQGDLVLNADHRAVEGLGFAWSPTERALERMRQAGAQPPPSPGDKILARVNRRDFLLPLERGLGLDFGKRLLSTMEQLRAALESSPHKAHLVRRPYGAAGRGSRRFGGRGQTLEAEDPGLTWLSAALGQGPLVVEPYVEVLAELSCHGWLPREASAARLGRPCLQQVSRQGIWQASRLAQPGELSPGEEQALLSATEAAGLALAAAGYFGPYGVDGLRYRDPASGATRLQPLGELNARLSMGWALGMGSSERDSWLAER